MTNQELLQQIAEVAWPLFKLNGPVNVIHLNEHGYEDLNGVLAGGEVLFLKVFGRRSVDEAQRYIDNHIAISSGSKANFPKLFTSPDGQGPLFISTIEDRQIPWCVMEYIDATLLKMATSISQVDLDRVIEQMALIHKATNKVHSQIDSWSPFALPEKLGLSEVLDEYEFDRATSIAQQLPDESLLSIAPIHGSIEPANLFRDEDGSIIVVDSGTVTNGPVIGDLAIFMMSCVLPVVGENSEDVRRHLVDQYRKHGNLTQFDEDAFPGVLKAACWSYLISARSAWGMGDHRDETQWWINIALGGLSRIGAIAQQ